MDLLLVPKDKDKITQKSGVIYRFMCAQDDCEEKYIEESAKTFGERLNEHLRATPALLYYYIILYYCQ